jgi:hypothetical protein
MKIRCSSLGKIMTNARSKSEVLSQTCKSYIQELVLEDLYGIKKEFSSRYTDKGNEVENESLELCERVLDLGFTQKNETFFENEWIKGTPDALGDKYVLDVKSSWSASTFPFFEDEVPNKDYYWQMQGYLWLTGKNYAILSYCLINTPEEIVNDEIRRMAWKKFELEPSEDTIRDVMALHNFDHISEHRRVKSWLIDKNEADIDAIKTRVEECRKYYNELLNLIM